MLSMADYLWRSLRRPERNLCRSCGKTYRCWCCGIDVEAMPWISLGEAVGLCSACYKRPTPFGWQMGDILAKGGLTRWMRWVVRSFLGLLVEGNTVAQLCERYLRAVRADDVNGRGEHT